MGAEAPLPPPKLAITGRGSVMIRVEGAGEAAPFFLDRTAVGVIAAERCAAHGCFGDAGLGRRGALPRSAAALTYEEAEAYCRWAGKRLPTADEWMRAANGGPPPFGLDHGAVDRDEPNALGFYGMTSGGPEWTSTVLEEPEARHLGGHGPELPGITGGDQFFVRCALDGEAGEPLPPAAQPVRLFADAGICARREATRETHCWGALPSLLGDESSAPIRVTALDTALAVDLDCVLWPETLSCDFDGEAHHRVVPAAIDRFFVGGGGIWILHGDKLVLVLTAGEAWMLPPEESLSAVFPAANGFYMQTRDRGARWVGINSHGEFVGEPVWVDAMPRPVQIFDLDGEQCLRFDAELRCGTFSYGGFSHSTSPRLPLREVVLLGDLRCMLLDGGAVHCSAGEASLPSEVGELPAPALLDVVQLVAAGDNLCAATKKGEVHCLTDELRAALATEGAIGSRPIGFARVRLPER
jgi:hypothetical protein